MEQKDQVRAFFGRHAAAYATSPGHRSGTDLDRLIQLLGPTASDSLLDVATATGNTGLAIAPFVQEMVGLDLTPQMEVTFKAEAEARGVTNARFVLGDVEQMPFDAGTFDLVTCRRAAHHFPRPSLAVAEMARVLRPGGRLGFVDMAAPEQTEGAELFNAMEKTRDSSHHRALSPEEWRTTVESAGLRVQHLELMGEEMPWPRWLAPVAVDGAEAQRAAALARSAPPGAARLVVRQEVDGTLTFWKDRIVLVAVKP